MKESKHKMLNVRITNKEKELLQERAAKQKISLSQLIREYCKSNK